MSLTTCSRSNALAITACIALCATPTAVFAQDEPSEMSDLSVSEKERLLKLVRRARKHYDAGKFEQALEEYEQAHAILPEPKLLYRIGLCHERLNHPGDALAAYTTYLARDPDTKKRGQLERQIEMLRAEVAEATTGQLVLTVNAEDARATLDGAPLEDPPFKARPPVGEATLRVEAPGRAPREKVIEIEPGSTTRLDWQLAKSSSDEVVIETKEVVIQQQAGRAAKRRAIGWTVAGVAGAGALGFWGASYLQAEQSRETGADVTLNKAGDAAQRARIFGGVAIGLGVVALSGATLAILQDGDSDTQTPQRGGLDVGVGPAAVHMRYRW